MTDQFDPADWLRRFAEAGGYVMPAPDGRIAAGWSLDDDAQWTAARADAALRGVVGKRLTYQTAHHLPT